VWHAANEIAARRVRVVGVRVARRAAEEKHAGCVWAACVWHAASEKEAHRLHSRETHPGFHRVLL